MGGLLLKLQNFKKVKLILDTLYLNQAKPHENRRPNLAQT